MRRSGLSASICSRLVSLPDAIVGISITSEGQLQYSPLPTTVSPAPIAYSISQSAAVSTTTRLAGSSRIISRSSISVTVIFPMFSEGSEGAFVTIASVAELPPHAVRASTTASSIAVSFFIFIVSPFMLFFQTNSNGRQFFKENKKSPHLF